MSRANVLVGFKLWMESQRSPRKKRCSMIITRQHAQGVIEHALKTQDLIAKIQMYILDHCASHNTLICA